MQKHSVSVVIPSAGNGQSLRKSVRSVFDQSLKPDEIIVVRNSHAPLEFDVVSELASWGVLFVDMKEKIGVSAARNIGINLANSTYIAFLDDDDEWLRDKLMLQMKFMLANKIQASTTNFLFKHGVKTRLFPEQSPHQVKRDLLRRCHCGPGSTLMVERRIVLELGSFSTDLERYEDWLFMISLKLKNYSYEHFDKVTAIVHRLDNSWRNNETAILHLNRKLSNFELTASTEISNGILFEKSVNFKRSRNYPQTLLTLIQWIAGYPPNICYLLGRARLRLIHRFLSREP